ncbi:hypothetical protein FQN54_000949 [Arachnomyces sp. PD_36]|nr:hypothetical protein FQN54_000949 [Arachnomyces sp. PD_36]
MAPKAPSKKRQSSHYESDNGFVANDSGEDVSHRSKKAKTSKSAASSTKPSFKSAATTKPAGAGESKVDSNGDQYWELSRLRRVTVSSFKGRTFVNVREYYEKDGQELPGKKGISMSVDQFSTMVGLLPSIETALKQKGESLPRPQYDVSTGKDSEKEPEGGEEEEEAQDDENEDVSEEEEEEAKPRSKTAKKSKTSRKRNIEETSDEDE